MDFLRVAGLVLVELPAVIRLILVVMTPFHNVDNVLGSK
jgi:hypothetical protein